VGHKLITGCKYVKPIDADLSNGGVQEPVELRTAESKNIA
jgi:hypothetical protein